VCRVCQPLTNSVKNWEVGMYIDRPQPLLGVCILAIMGSLDSSRGSSSFSADHSTDHSADHRPRCLLRNDITETEARRSRPVAIPRQLVLRGGDGVGASSAGDALKSSRWQLPHATSTTVYPVCGFSARPFQRCWPRAA